jgi:hypothetical protein
VTRERDSSHASRPISRAGLISCAAGELRGSSSRIVKEAPGFRAKPVDLLQFILEFTCLFESGIPSAFQFSP